MIPRDWHLAYLGKPWAAVPDPPQSYTCGELVRAVHRDMFGIDSPEILADPRILRECVAAMEPGRFGLRPLAADERPRQFDVAFMMRAQREDHVGIGCMTADGLLILHCMQGAGVILDSPGELRGTGVRRINWYRHKNIPERVCRV